MFVKVEQLWWGGQGGVLTGLSVCDCNIVACVLFVGFLVTFVPGVMWLDPEAFWWMSGRGCAFMPALFCFVVVACNYPRVVLFVLLTAMKKVSSRNPGLSLLFATFVIIACGSCDLLSGNRALVNSPPKCLGRGWFVHMWPCCSRVRVFLFDYF